MSAAAALTAAVAAGLLMVAATGPASASSSASTSRSDAIETAGPDWTGARTLTYCIDGGQPQLMTLFAPTAVDHAVPVVLEVHGGGWHAGSRLLSLSESETATDLVGAGLVVASIDYRLSPQNPWPDQIDDVKCAVRFLRAHALDLGLDPDRIAALGTSAGGQLVSLLGTTGTTPLWDVGPYKDVSSRVEAVVDEFGPAELNAGNWPPVTFGMIRGVFGATPGSASPTLLSASPFTYVSAGDPPFLILQGTDDHVVPPSQSKAFAGKLQSAGVPTQLVLVERGDHGLTAPSEIPSSSAIAALITTYLERVLHV